MIPVESQAVAEVMFWYFIGMVALIVAFLFLDWFAEKLIDANLSSPEEISQREAERIAKQATKEYKRRQRLRSVRFFNF